MDLYAVIDQIASLLQQRGRLAYRALKLQFHLDEEQLAAVKEELIATQELAVEKDGTMLVWKGAEATPTVPSSTSSQPPVSYTPSHLAERIRTEQVAREARGNADGERKTITALFADLKGSTALIEGLDPEEARAIIDPALQLMMDAVHRYEGYVAQALGDGIFALFGAPLAQEDHPQRALYAALRMQENMRGYGDQIRLKHGVPLAMRVGVNTGEVVVRSIRKDDLHTDYVPVGHSTNLAARMEQMATPGSILVTAYTYKLTEGYFAFKALGQTQIKGVEEPLHVYEVLGARSLRTRLQVSAAQRGLTRFVGRRREMDQLQHALSQAQAGNGQIVGVMGEPGLGKSRLFHEFIGAYSRTPRLVLRAYSVSHGKASPYLPVIELLKSYFDIQVADEERKRREKITGKVLTLDRSLEGTLPYLFALLGIEEQPSPLQQMDAQIRRQRTVNALKKLLFRESLTQPLLLIFEDLHWIDSETQGFLDTLSEGMASTKIVLLVNYRPEYRHEWGQKTYYTQLRLAPFGTAEAEEFLAVLLGNPTGGTSRSPLRDLQRLILERAEGTPFFMEEVVQTLAEEGVLSGERGQYRLERVPTDLHISPTVQGVLAARIDRLAPDEKALLQQLAVIGREFPVSLLRHVIAHPEDELYRLLAALQRKEFLYEQPAFPEVEYSFKHALTQEVAYGMVLQERRKALHERTAQAIEALYGQCLEDHYRDLAYHYSRSGNTQKAVEYLQRAGQQALQHAAHAEVITHLTTALEFLTALPDTPERAQHELTLHLTLGPALLTMKGFTAPEVQRTYARAYALCQQDGRPQQLLEALAGLRAFYLVRGEMHKAREVVEQSLRLAQRGANPLALINAHGELGETLSFQGEVATAHAHLEQAWTLYSVQEPHLLHGLTENWEDPGVWLLSRTAVTLWLLGYADQARKRLEECLALAASQSRASRLAYAWSTAGWFHAVCQEWPQVRARAEEIIRLSTEQGFPFTLAYGTALGGLALAAQGQVEDGIVQLRDGLASFQTAGAELARLDHLPWLATAYARGERAAEGLAVLSEMLTLVDNTGARSWEAELHRLKGELTLQQFNVQGSTVSVDNPQPAIRDPQLEAEACFHQALDIARRQQAKSWELRATISLARLWQQQGKIAEAHALLSAIYGWFTEGFDTTDLQEAKVLLAQLTEGR
jgi:class 3 adenylate cyclase/tetratricopeptide (TPR) repeat protein